MRLTSGTGCGASFGNVNGLFEQPDGLGQQRRAGGVERGQRLAFLDARAAAGMEYDAGVGIDRFAGLLPARAGALHGPAEGSGVHLGDEAALPCLENSGCAGLVKG